MKDIPQEIADRLEQYSTTLRAVASKLGYFCPGSLAVNTLNDLAGDLARDAATLSIATRNTAEPGYVPVEDRERIKAASENIQFEVVHTETIAADMEIVMVPEGWRLHQLPTFSTKFEEKWSRVYDTEAQAHAAYDVGPVEWEVTLKR